MQRTLQTTTRAVRATVGPSRAALSSSSSTLLLRSLTTTSSPTSTRRLAPHAGRTAMRAFSSSPTQKSAADMTNIIASSPDDYVSVVSLTPSAGFTLSDGLVVPSPILMIDGNCFLWDVDHPTVGSRPDGKPKSDLGFDWNGWSKDKLAIFETLSPRPEIVLFGTGQKGLFAPPAVRTYLNGLGIQVDVLDSRNASSTFNLLQEEGRRVAAALYPVSHLSARTGLVA
ncbi:hypothetical protein BMF94_3507 [Rhodotorula taiwanensis]|uniref:NADH dehydrogenase [ubiquinone] 1 alpha subcomplex assembly factor 3 n=1 Tax=Rhodotorula taiwanensis TaxID=741276 RepID=A0A2S5B9Y1_9BASI|nr:hypothetical protein BMF94_3507 [Rhodotorula taiwanensis]